MSPTHLTAFHWSGVAGMTLSMKVALKHAAVKGHGMNITAHKGICVCIGPCICTCARHAETEQSSARSCLTRCHTSFTNAGRKYVATKLTLQTTQQNEVIHTRTTRHRFTSSCAQEHVICAVVKTARVHRRQKKTD